MVGILECIIGLMSCGCRRMVLPMWNHPVKDEQKGNTRTSDIATSLPCCLQFFVVRC
ncbi:hypothetical protein LINPERHAP1_LOCUS21060 [Linum perenne]